MNVPLNIDWQQILLHLMNFAILAGGLYLLLYKPVKQFMAKREAYYQGLADQAADKLREAEALKADCQAKLDASDEEIRQKKAKAQHDAQVAAEQQLDEPRFRPSASSPTPTRRRSGIARRSCPTPARS